MNINKYKEAFLFFLVCSGVLFWLFVLTGIFRNAESICV